MFYMYGFYYESPINLICYMLGSYYNSHIFYCVMDLIMINIFLMYYRSNYDSPIFLMFNGSSYDLPIFLMFYGSYYVIPFSNVLWIAL